MSTTNLHRHQFGQPLNIFKFTSDKDIEIDNVVIEQLFNHPDVINRKIVPISIIGAFRKGKSFSLDYILRFLYKNYPSINNPNPSLSYGWKNWMGDPNDPLVGFSWRSGTKRVTTGIVIWSDVFLHTLESGEKIAIVVMDTQGLFDNETSSVDNSRIFALGTLISSIQILNLMQSIQEDHLQYLQFATEFAKFTANQGTFGRPFQNLTFLIRDWQNPDEFTFGSEGGAKYLRNVLEIKKTQTSELKSVREHISSSFESLSCFLLPYPGNAVACTKNYDGKYADMDPTFKNELERFIEILMRPSNLVIKKINQKELRGSDMKDFLIFFFKLFQSENLPKVKNIYETMVHKQMSELMMKCIDHYNELILKDTDQMTENNLCTIHDKNKQIVLNMFKQEKKMGNAEHVKEFYEQLEVAIENIFKEWSDRSLKLIEKIREECEKTRAEVTDKFKKEQESIDVKRRNMEMLQNTIIMSYSLFKMGRAGLKFINLLGKLVD